MSTFYEKQTFCYSYALQFLIKLSGHLGFTNDLIAAHLGELSVDSDKLDEGREGDLLPRPDCFVAAVCRYFYFASCSPRSRRERSFNASFIFEGFGFIRCSSDVALYFMWIGF